jgi:hypothetical protein
MEVISISSDDSNSSNDFPCGNSTNSAMLAYRTDPEATAGKSNNSMVTDSTPSGNPTGTVHSELNAHTPSTPAFTGSGNPTGATQSELNTHAPSAPASIGVIRPRPGLFLGGTDATEFALVYPTISTEFPLATDTESPAKKRRVATKPASKQLTCPTLAPTLSTNFLTPSSSSNHIMSTPTPGASASASRPVTGASAPEKDELVFPNPDPTTKNLYSNWWLEQHPGGFIRQRDTDWRKDQTENPTLIAGFARTSRQLKAKSGNKSLKGKERRVD